MVKKPKRPKRLFLYLAIACFAGLVSIFIVDGYMGIHDTIRVTVGEYEREVEASYWERDEHKGVYGELPSASVSEKVLFSYQIDNNQFSEYSTRIEASVWQENEKIIDLFSEDVSVARLGKATVKWELTAEDLGGVDISPGQRRNYMVRINCGEVERKIIVSYYYPYPYPEVPSPAKPEPVR